MGYIKSEVARVNSIEEAINNSAPGEKYRAITIDTGATPADSAESILDILSSKVNLRTQFEAADDAFEKIK